MNDITSSQFIMVLIFIGLLLIFACPCDIFGSLRRQLGGAPLRGGRSEGQPCSDGLAPCGRGMQCFQNVCIKPRTKDDDMFGS